MKLQTINYSSDGVAWQCSNKKHSDISLRKGSWFEKSNLTLEEIIELTYWWSTGNVVFKTTLSTET